MKAAPFLQHTIRYGGDAVAHVVVWQVPQPVPGSAHLFKYRLAYVVNDACVLRYDNETGKGDHKHWGADELPYAFRGTDALMADFLADIERWNNAHGLV